MFQHGKCSVYDAWKIPVINRRSAIRLALGASSLLVAPGLLLPARAASNASPQLGLRGAIDAGQEGVRPGGGDASARKLISLIRSAARQNMPVFLPPGTYEIGDLDLPDGSRLIGVPGASRLTLSSGRRLVGADNARRISLSGLVFEGQTRPLGDDRQALLAFTGIEMLSIDDCDIIGSGSTGIMTERCGGRIEHNRITGAAEYGLLAIDSTGLAITGNTVADCGNGGVLVHRWEKGQDGTIVTGNRIERTGAGHGGTGQYGNAINLYRAGGVIVSGNQIAQSAFSAIRANSASNAQITDNQCLQSGETAIYSEFSFEGAVISGNIVDGAANGISAVNFNEGGRMATIANNIVRNLSLAGPYTQEDPIFGVGISVEADTTVSGNVIENAPFWGMSLGFGNYLRNVIASGNVIRQARIGCAVTVVEGAGPAILSGNLFQGMKDGAIIGHRWRDAATAELALGGSAAAAYPQLTIVNNQVG
jgi:uncharacterized secreted repeat protein (TIGR03808 family)